MRATLATLSLCCALAAAPGSTTAQSVLHEADVGVVTTAGLYLVRDQGPAILLADPAAFGGTLVTPAIEWRRGTDSFFVVSGGSLYLATVLAASAGGAAVTDLSPTFPAPTDALLYDLDVDPRTGHLWVLERGHSRAARFAAPFVPGLAPDLVVPIGSNVRALAVDSRQYPFSLVYAEGDRITRQHLDGTTSTLLLKEFNNGLDVDAQIVANPFFVQANSHDVGYLTSSPNLWVFMNIMPAFPFPIVPVILFPTDIEWDSITRRAYVLGEQGVTAAAFPGATGPNHIVRFPISPQASLPPRLITHLGASGIAGTAGDIALVSAPFAFAAPYGPSCTSFVGDAESPRLDTAPSYGGRPFAGNADFRLDLTGAPPLGATWMFAGFVESALSFQECQLLVEYAPPTFVGSTDAAGNLSVPVPLVPFSLSLIGLDIFLQSATLDAIGKPIVSPGLMLHLGL